MTSGYEFYCWKFLNCLGKNEHSALLLKRRVGIDIVRNTECNSIVFLSERIYTSAFIYMRHMNVVQKCVLYK